MVFQFNIFRSYVLIFTKELKSIINRIYQILKAKGQRTFIN